MYIFVVICFTIFILIYQYIVYNKCVLLNIIHLIHIVQEVLKIINIDARSSTPIYEQIINSIKELILKGILSPGDKLPSVRELANTLTTNPNTVSKAYGELERLKIIETLRGKGTFVSNDYKPKIEEDKILKLKDNLKKVILDAHYMGLDKEQINNLVENIYKELVGNSGGVQDE